MTNLDTTEVRGRTLTAFFDTRATADNAVRDLAAAGIPQEHMRLLGEGSTSSATAAGDDKGFWESLKDIFMPDEDRHAYVEGLRRGGYLVAVRLDEANYNRVIDILDRDGAIDMDQREASWRTEGWQGFQAGEAGLAGAGMGTAAYTTTTGAATRPTPATGLAGQGRTLKAGEDEVIPVYEEQIRNRQARREPRSRSLAQLRRRNPGDRADRAS